MAGQVARIREREEAVVIGVVCERTSGNASVAAIDEYDRIGHETGFVNHDSATNLGDAQVNPAPASHPPVDVHAVFRRLVDRYGDVLRQLAD